MWLCLRRGGLLTDRIERNVKEIKGKEKYK